MLGRGDDRHKRAGASRPAAELFCSARTASRHPAQIIRRATAALGRPPSAIPQLHTEGTLPSHGIREIRLKAKQDQPIVLNLALAWRLTGDHRFLAAATRYLDAWVTIYRPSFNLIDETGFDTLIMATDLTKADATAALRARLANFWRALATGYLDAMDGRPEGATGNWQSHRIKLAAMAAFETGDPRLIERACNAYRRQISANILPDGSVTDFTERDALHYVTYDLDPLLMAAASARAHGEDWFAWESPSGSSLPRALRWLEPFALGKRTHVEFVRSTVAFDRARADAGDPEYAPHPWRPRSAAPTFALATLSDPSWRTLADTVAMATSRPPSGWVTLLGHQGE